MVGKLILRRLQVLGVVFFISTWSSACANVEKPESERVHILISAAVSLTESLEEIKSVYEKQQSEVSLSFNFGASGSLRQQIEQGANADVFLSADEKNMKRLVELNIVNDAEYFPFIANQLVVIVSNDRSTVPQTVQDLHHTTFKHIAVGEPRTVPAGTYTKEALIGLEQWDLLQEKVVFGNNVRQVLSYIETGNADAGFVYMTDALSSGEVNVAFTIDSVSHQPIHYYAGVVKGTKQPEKAHEFYEYLKTEEAQTIFQKYGFSNTKK